MKIKRRRTRRIYVGNIPVGGGAKIAVQTMTKSFTHHTSKVIEEIKMAVDAGCDLIRVAVPDAKSVKSFEKIREKSPIPLIADVHFDYRLALQAIDAGADCVRINPGNIGGEERTQVVVEKAKKFGISLRIGVNSGSLEKEILEKYKRPSPEALVESALRWDRFLKSLDFYNFKVSIKSTNPIDTVESNLAFSAHSDTPLHIGVTESGTELSGAVRSSVALTVLLMKGVGDTIRVSLPSPPYVEVIVGKRILESLNLRESEGVNVIACPTCGRCRVDVKKYAEEIEKLLIGLKKPITIAVMGCVVNGPGEAKFADIGVVGGKDSFLLYVKGKKVKKVKPSDVLSEIMREVESLTNS